MSAFRKIFWTLTAACAAMGSLYAESSTPLSFNQHIRPILSDNCFKCHGADDKTRKGNLRLDVREDALKPAKSGELAIVPGKPDESELIKRIVTDDEDDLMPPLSTKKALSSNQKELLRQWIAEGAKYENHWAFEQPKQVNPPEVKATSWPKNPIDHFVLARLEKEVIKTSAPADRHALIRRVYLDLVGLLPSPAEVDEFVNDTSEDSYKKVVDRLLSSPRYGERWARRWLDLARYADSNGYEKDRARLIWAYRDWVIQALNDDMPFDEFTIKQLAGDMLPGATLQDRIATGFHRNTMINEEGGIDPLEFRYYAVVDRVATTGAAWLGLTVGCAQCHTHKYDPITHKEYYQFFSFLNNADELEMPVLDAAIKAKREEMEKEIRRLEEELPSKFYVDEMTWESPSASVSSNGESSAERLSDGSWRFGPPEKAIYSFSFAMDASKKIRALKVEALADESLPNKGSGQSSGGNFVLSEIQAFLVVPESSGQTNTIKIAKARADFAQDGFSVDKAIDNDAKTGWAVHPKTKENHWAIFEFNEPVEVPAGAKLVVKLDQQYGSKHILGRTRLSLGVPIPDKRPLHVRRQEALDKKYAQWLKEEFEKAVHWTTIKPLEAKSNEPILTILDDHSVLASADQTKSDTYELRYKSPLKRITAIRLEALPHPSLPSHGPGRVYYEGTKGDFFLSEFKILVGGKPVKIKSATEDFAHTEGSTKYAAALTFDGDAQTGWSTRGQEGKPHAVVYQLAEPLEISDEMQIKMLFERYYASGLGRFRISVTGDEKPAEVRGLTSEAEAIAVKSADERTTEEKEKLFRHFLSITPELAEAREEIQKLKKSLPEAPTTLVFAERPEGYTRKTKIHHRGEYLQAKEEVSPGVPAVLHSVPPDAPKNRLTFAQWLVSTNNPLTARVTVNRQWQAFFGRGIVRTMEDFGFQGSAPSHPELLDWLAVEFMKQGWSMKKLHRMIVMSATYQQSSEQRPELLEKDPDNILLARGPRFRLEAEVMRDAILRASGLLSEKMGGPSVFPPQPASITTEGAYQPFTWKTSTGEDRYRRSLYTFAKRTAPFAMFNTFDAPTGEACVPRREVSNTPLQALTLLNDVLMVEASQALGKKLAESDGEIESKVDSLFKRCVNRSPSQDEARLLVQFYKNQKERLEKKEIDAAKIAGASEGENTTEVAAWTTVARAVLNLDEFVTKE